MARPAKRLSVSVEDKLELEKLLASGVAQVRVVLRVLALRQMGDGRSASEAAGMVRLTGKAVRELADRYRAGGLERALYDKQRPGKARLLDVRARQRIIAMVCGEPPVGQARWSVRLIVEQALKRKLVPKLGRETVRILLQDHDFKPWREKNVVRSGTQRGVHRADGGGAGNIRKAL
jgi:putative transposase